LKVKRLLFLAFSLAVAADANALIFGIRYSDLAQQPLPAIADNGAKGRFGAYLGFKEKKSLFLVGADYDRFKMERGDTLLYSRRLVINAGYRYQLLPKDKAEAMDFMPFWALHLFKSFSKVKADSSIMSGADVDYYNDISNDVGGWIALGAEYYFAPAFSFGGEAGLRYTRAKSKAYGHEIKISHSTTSVALILTFYW
jgi:hypothetical protein